MSSKILSTNEANALFGPISINTFIPSSYNVLICFIHSTDEPICCFIIDFILFGSRGKNSPVTFAVIGILGSLNVILSKNLESSIFAGSTILL